MYLYLYHLPILILVPLPVPLPPIVLYSNVMKPAHKTIEKRDKCLRNKPLRGGNPLYITQMNNSPMIQMKRPPFYI